MFDVLLDKLPLGWAIKFAILRLIARWRSFITVIVGVLLAAVIGANVPLYTQTVSQVGLLERLRQNPLEDIHIHSRVTYTPDGETDLDHLWQDLDIQVQAEVNSTLRANFPDWVDYSTTGMESSPLQVYRDAEQIPATRLRIAHYSAWTDGISIVEGILPEEPSDTTIDVEVAIPFQMAIALDVRVGDTLTLVEDARDSSLPIVAQITAIIIEENFTNARWFEPSPLRVDQGSPLEANLLTTRESALRLANDFIPETRSRLHWRIVFDYTSVPFSDVDRAISQLENFENNIETILDFPQSSFVYSNAVIPIIEDYQEEVSRLSAPFGLLLLQIGALVLLFLVVIAALVRRGERREIAMLQSRGSFDRQIVLVRGLEALIVCAGCALIAPLLAKQVLVWVTPKLMNVEGISLEISNQAYLLSSIAAGFALIVLLLTLRPVLKLPLISAGGSALRAETQLWWQRYYLDMVLILLGIAGLWRLLNNNSTLVQTSQGETRADPLLLLTPALLFLALGSALLRLFPLIMRLIATLFSARPGLGGALAGWQVSRESVHYARITFLLALSVGIGWFATSFQATINRSQRDQAYYQVGTDLQVHENLTYGVASPPPTLEEYLAIPEIDSATQVLRFSDVGVAINTISFGTGDLLGVDYETLSETAFWRDDLGELSSPASDLTQIRSGRPFMIVPSRIGIWVKLNSVLDGEGDINDFERLSALPYLIFNTTPSIQFANENGQNISMGLVVDEIEGFDLANIMELNPFSNSPEDHQELLESLSGWVHFVGEIPSDGFDFNESTNFTSITFRMELPFNNNGLFELFITELNIEDTEGNLIDQNWLVDDSWNLFAIEQLTPLRFFEIQHDGMRGENNGGQRWIWSQTNNNSLLIQSLNPVEQPPIPAIVSESFLELNNLEVGLTFPLSVNQQPLTFEIIDSVTYYPTLYNDRPFIIADLNLLINRMNGGSSLEFYPNETWINLHDGTSDIEFLQQLQLENPERGLIVAETHTETLNKFSTDPLSLGLIGLLFLSFLVVLVLSIISLFTYAGLTAQARKTEFGVLQALGLSSGRVVYSLAVEQLLVVGISVIIGAIIGTVLSSQVLPTLANSTSTQAIAPPFVVQTETDALLQYGSLMLVVLSLVLIFTLLLVRQVSLSQALRLGEE